MSANQPEDLTEQMISEMDLDQQMQLTEKEDRRNILMIGGIEIFLPLIPEEAEIYVAEETTTTIEGQIALNFKEELE
jgi:hypothetical protein